MKALAALYSDESGATLVEYSLIVAFIAVVCIAVVLVFGQEVNSKYNTIATSV
jgi:pilus assembly protein Flp/PilA